MFLCAAFYTQIYSVKYQNCRRACDLTFHRLYLCSNWLREYSNVRQIRAVSTHFVFVTLSAIDGFVSHLGQWMLRVATIITPFIILSFGRISLHSGSFSVFVPLLRSLSNQSNRYIEERKKHFFTTIFLS